MKLRIEQDRRVRRITLASQATRNIVDATLAADLLREWSEAEADDGTGAVLLDSDGPIFCGGMDFSAPIPAELFTIGSHARKPIVAAIQGVAISAGIALIANAHVVVAAQGSSFGLTDIREGRYHPGVFDAVSKAIGERRAKELTLTGRVFSTPEALSWGLLHSVAPAFELDDRASSIASNLANADPTAVRSILERH